MTLSKERLSNESSQLVRMKDKAEAAAIRTIRPLTMVLKKFPWSPQMVVGDEQLFFINEFYITCYNIHDDDGHISMFMIVCQELNITDAVHPD